MHPAARNGSTCALPRGLPLRLTANATGTGQCAECHAEKEDHELAKTVEMAFLCKKCKKAFRKDMTAFEESDEYCPHCDNHFVRRAESKELPRSDPDYTERSNRSWTPRPRRRCCRLRETTRGWTRGALRLSSRLTSLGRGADRPRILSPSG